VTGEPVLDACLLFVAVLIAGLALLLTRMKTR
jgi:hypothetical protein